MKPLKQCPHCNIPLDRFQYNERWFQEHCPKSIQCPIKYYQYYAHSFDDKELSYVTFHTKKFSVYAYFDSHEGFRNTFYIYSVDFPRGAQSQPPLFKVEAFEIDFNNLDKLDRRWNNLSLFI